MKIASLLAGAAALSLMAAPALAEGPIYKGATTGTIANPLYVNPFLVFLTGPANYTGTFQTGSTLGNVVVGLADVANPSVNSSIALFTLSSDGFAANSGDLNASAGATFAMTGNVDTDCAYYTGGTNTDIAFGTIGINAQGNNPTAAFEMIGGNRSVSIETNLAGCNTKNTVTISKTDLVNSANTGGYDAAQFTNTIPVTLTAGFTAPSLNTTNAIPRTVNMAVGSQVSQGSYGAWKSAMDIDLTLQNPGLGLLSGNYVGSVSVQIASTL